VPTYVSGVSNDLDVVPRGTVFRKELVWKRAKMDIAAGKNRPLCRQKWTLLQHMLFGKGKKWTSLD